MGRRNIISARSRAVVQGFAPGHTFRAEGFGVEGGVTLAPGSLLALEARFPLGRLDAGDILKNRELGRFLELKRQPVATAELRGETTLTTSPTGALSGQGRIALMIGPRRMECPVAFTATLPRATARFTLSFSGLGYEPPKLLFLKMKDLLEVDIQVELTDESPVP